MENIRRLFEKKIVKLYKILRKKYYENFKYFYEVFIEIFKQITRKFKKILWKILAKQQLQP